MPRYYGRSGGMFGRGNKEDPERCAVAVPQPPHYLFRYQCSRRRGKGSGELEGQLCGQHARMQEQGRLGAFDLPKVQP